MIVRVFDKGPTSECAIKYNMTKYHRGASAFVGDEKSARMRIANIRENERNPFLWPGASSLGFHMSINPSISDGIAADTDVQDLAESLLESIGMTGQPWVLFREDDRDHNARVHYHVVSTRARNDGHTVHLLHYKRLMSAYKEWAISKGLPVSESFECKLSNQKFGEPFTFDHRLEKTSQLRYALETALKYDFDGFEEFSAILRTMNVGVRVSSKKEKESLLFYGMDKQGKSCTHLYSHIDKTGKELEKARNHRRGQISSQEMEDICTLMESQIILSSDYSQYEKHLQESGIYIGRKDGEIIVIDVCNHCVIREEQLEKMMDPLYYGFLIDSSEELWPEKERIIQNYSVGVDKSVDKISRRSSERR